MRRSSLLVLVPCLACGAVLATSREAHAGPYLGLDVDLGTAFENQVDFAYGLGASLYFPLAAGASSVLSPEPFDASRSWRLIVDERPTLLFSVPSVYRAMLDQAELLEDGQWKLESLFEPLRHQFKDLAVSASMATLSAAVAGSGRIRCTRYGLYRTA